MNTLLAILALASSGSASVEAIDLNGKKMVIPAAGKPTVVFFVGTECPIANRLMPELQRIVKGNRPVVFYFVYADRRLAASAAKKHAKEFELAAPALLDPKHALVNFAKATVTPEAVLYDKAGKVAYRGRINDSYAEHNRPRNQPAKNDLRDAIAAVLASKPVLVPYVEPVGCPIPDIDRS